MNSLPAKEHPCCNPRNRKLFPILLLSFLGASQSACGGGPSPVITIAVTSPPGVTNGPITVQAGASAQVSAQVTGDPRNAGVNWNVTCSAASCGNVSPSSSANQGVATYRAPQTLPASNLNVTLTATSATESSAQGSLMITIPSVTVAVTPASPAVRFGGQIKFTATVSGDSSNAGVSWILHVCQNHGFGQMACEDPPSCNCGMISSPSSASGAPITYTAAGAPAGGELTLVATSVANPDAITTVPITVSANAAGLTGSSPFQESQDAGPQVRYTLLNLGTLGGTASNGFGGPTNRGWVSGDANLAGDQTEHGFLWRDGVMTDLGTLGGLNSSVPTPVKDEIGLVTGVAQTATFDPLGEFWGITFFCGAANCEGYQNLELGFLWQDGVMTPLPTLGGNNGASLGANNRGEVVGVAETAIRDTSCAPPQMLDFAAVIWGPKPGQIRILPAFPGDSVAAAFGINDNGQVVGISGVCQVPGFFAFGVHPVLWEKGTVTNLGGFGGVMFNAANAINNRGQVVGQSDLPGDTFTHAFFWQNGAMTDLGTLPGDSNSIATDINDQGQVVGVSCDATSTICRAFLWENGVMTDLNALIPSDSPLFLTYGAGINDRGEIAGTAFDPSTGASPAFLAIPDHALVTAEIERRSVPKITLPENVRKLLQRRMRGLQTGIPQ